MSEDNHNLESKVMSDITTGRVKMRSRYLFAAEKFGLGSAVILTILLAVLTCTVVLFYFVSADSLTYLQFGNPGLLAFLESFPFPLVITLILLIFIAGRLLALTGRVYKYSYGIVALALLLLVFGTGFGLAATDVAEKISTRPILAPFVHPKLGEHSRGVAGRVILISENVVVVQTPRSEISVDTFRAAWQPEDERPEPGMFVVAIGKWHGDSFVANHIKIVPPEELRLLRLRVPPRLK